MSDHYDGEKFFNPGKDELKTFWDVLKWKATSDKVPWPEFVPNDNFPFRTLSGEDRGIITYINHSTVLIQLPGLTILTDPLYSDRTSPFQFIGPKRIRYPGLAFENLPVIDVVLISHNHYDHLDMETIKKLDNKFHPLFLVPLGDKELLLSHGVEHVRAMDWWEDIQIKDTLVTFTPSRHWSARWLWDKNDSLWGSFMIANNNLKIYFAGDTGYGNHFKAIHDKLGAPDLSLLPIGSYKPSWFMKFHHMNPEDAVLAHLDLRSKKSLPIHFGTFQLSDEGFDEPLLDLDIARKKYDISQDRFYPLDQGESLEL